MLLADQPAKKYLARTMRDFTTKVLNTGRPLPRPSSRVSRYSRRRENMADRSWARAEAAQERRHTAVRRNLDHLKSGRATGKSHTPGPAEAGSADSWEELRMRIALSRLNWAAGGRDIGRRGVS